MADRKWSELDATTPTDSDDVALRRGSQNFRWSFTALRTYLDGFFATDSELAAHTTASNPHSNSASSTDLSNHTGAANPHSGSASDADVTNAVNAHDASGAAHGGVESNFAAHAGAGGATHPAATTSVSGFQSAADKTKLDGVATNANNYSHPNHTGDVTSTGDGAQVIAAAAVTTTKIANDAVDNAKLANMAANTVKARGATSGDPVDLTEAAATDLGLYSPGDGLLGWKQGADIGRFTSVPSGGASTFTGLTDTPASYSGQSGRFAAVTGAEDALEFVDPPSGTGDVTSTTNTNNNELQAGDVPAKGIKNTGILAANVLQSAVNIPTGNIVSGVSGRTLGDAAIAANQLAQKNVANVFTVSPQTINTATGLARILTQSGDDLAAVGVFPGNGTANNRRYEMFATGGNLFISSTQDDGTTVVSNGIQLTHVGGMSLGAPTGGTPTTEGHANFTAVQVMGVNVALAPSLMTDGNVVFADTGARSVKDGGFSGDALVRNDNTTTIGEVGYPLTPTADAAASLAVTLTGNSVYRSTRTGALTVDTSGITGNGQMVIDIPSTVTAASVSPALANEEGSDPGTGNRRLYLEAVNSTAGSNVYGWWTPSG